MSNRQAPLKETAIALSYDGRDVPKVIAKGKGELAQRIVELAEEHDVPLHEDPELSAALARIDLGTSIPPELYQAVAEVLSFALYLSGKHEEILRRARGDDPEETGKD